MKLVTIIIKSIVFTGIALTATVMANPEVSLSDPITAESAKACAYIFALYSLFQMNDEYGKYS